MTRGTIIPDFDRAHPLSLERVGALATVTLQRPDMLNALDGYTAVALRDTLRALSDDDAVRAVVLTGAGRAFCAGVDIGAQDEALDTGVFLRTVIGPTITTLRTMPKPVVAAVHGAVAGVGCSIALAADLVVAAESAYFLLAFARLGLTLDGGASVLVPARIGMGGALRLGLLAERLHAAEAARIGLIDRLVPDAELSAATATLATELSTGPTRSYAATKRLINEATLAGLGTALEAEATAQSDLVQTADHHEAVLAFQAKRSPKFQGH